MEILRDDVLALIYQAIDSLSEHSPVKINKSPDTELLGCLDSLGFVNLLATIEELAESRFGKNLGISGLVEGTHDQRNMTIADLAHDVLRSLA